MSLVILVKCLNHEPEVLDKSLQGLEVLNFIALLNLGNDRRIEGNLKDIHIDWLAHCMQDVYTGL
jgi:hypothetical protein